MISLFQIRFHNPAHRLHKTHIPCTFCLRNKEYDVAFRQYLEPSKEKQKIELKHLDGYRKEVLKYIRNLKNLQYLCAKVIKNNCKDIDRLPVPASLIRKAGEHSAGSYAKEVAGFGLMLETHLNHEYALAE